jgi:hypothetical protein
VLRATTPWRRFIFRILITAKSSDRFEGHLNEDSGPPGLLGVNFHLDKASATTAGACPGYHIITHLQHFKKGCYINHNTYNYLIIYIFFETSFVKKFTRE